MLAYTASNGARTIIVEARDLMVQEVGFAKRKALGITLVAADSRALFSLPCLFVTTTPPTEPAQTEQAQ